ncbi:MAG TPA: DUF2442 domain-containing protein [Segetibacter sp.]|nr:DUF2442 domain-containing protein [Segetibacter sp.]
MKFPKLISVTAIGKYKLYVRFSDASEGEYDVSHLAGKGVFKTWDTDNNFFKVSINTESGAITWPGELDIDTINVYCKMKGVLNGSA